MRGDIWNGSHQLPIPHTCPPRPRQKKKEEAKMEGPDGSTFIILRKNIIRELFPK